MRQKKYLVDKDSYKSSGRIDYSIKERREREWLNENKVAIDKQNERIEKYGCFSDEYRKF